MRSSKNRSRNKNNNRNRSVGNVVNRVFDSSGPEGKVRGTPQQIIDKYSQLARDAHLSNDRVAVENFQQHAEHYTRMLGAALKEQEARREQQEAQNRNRQKEQRDQNDRPQGGASPEADPGSMPQPDLANPDIVEVPETASSGLVETPENAKDGQSQKPARTQRRKPKSEEQASPVETPPSAAE